VGAPETSEPDPRRGPERLLLEVRDRETLERLRERARDLACRFRPLSLNGLAPAGTRQAGDSPSESPRPDLEEATALSRALLEGTRDEVLVADRNGRVTFTSPRLAELAGLPYSDVAGADADRILRALDLPAFEELRAMLSCVSCARMEAEVVDPSGQTRPVLLRGVSTRLEGERQRFVWFITELTRIRSVERANRILRSELETQSRLLALVSHELRTPLNVVLGQLSLLRSGLHGELTDVQLDSVSRSERAGQSLLAIINDLIDFARLESEELEVDVEPFRLSDLLREAAEVAEFLTAETDLRVQIRDEHLAAGLEVRADRERTRQILIQLLTNAVKFSERGTIRLDAVGAGAALGGERPPGGSGGGGTVPGDRRSAERFVAVDVRDSGIGISDEELERVFEPFHQTAELLNREEEGTGLGLAIARRLARRQGGDLVAARSGEGGSVFRLYLPRAEG